MDKKVAQLRELLSKYKVFFYAPSKSTYNKVNPENNILWNAYVLTKDTYGLLQLTFVNGDVELNDNDTIQKLKNICSELKQDIYLYRESTVHNETFNGRIFPYKAWDAHVKYLSQDNVVVELKNEKEN